MTTRYERPGSDDLMIVAKQLAGMVEGQLRRADCKSIVPTVYVLMENVGEPGRGIGVFVAADPGDNDDWKAEFTAGIGREIFDLRKLPLVAVGVFEAWMSSAKIGTPPPCAPSKDPNRQDVIVLGGLTVDLKLGCYSILPITRNPDGTIQPCTFDIVIEPTGEFAGAPFIEDIFISYAHIAQNWLNRQQAQRQ